ncbi:TPA: hypothetical protein ACXIGC_001170 [Stenotrophomonas maltophilia]|uniref:hypothetical protein n=1 Tax=Stenotrophomonas maltophilia TaxID=40324 RepID=UPI0013DA68DE|nr:hypothetical protein [Stenotrophomonas maltophilia]MBH1464681.1 hypothetical protein [Stenotrophomonas maltophilia]MBH1612176.1 hypothetical protein [Stenotrophomonas maltophilia]MBH1715908.1 hypothetical protein [Stenotrophomonas maltophilia]MBN5166978.1 hypothetical protein [Stenotrophomonas maltophilia]HEL3236775.1 hypothetical protein [Stenotrophomonas maltophilia]
MSNSINSALLGNKSSLEKLKLFLEEEVKSSKNQKVIDFAEAYPVIEQHLIASIPQKLMLEKFNAAYGHKMHAPQFRKLLEAERARRNESGEVIACSLCGTSPPRIKENVTAADAAPTVTNG